MPANRSRTDRWRQSLEKIRSRGGGLEFTVNNPSDVQGQESKNLVWRVRLLDYDDKTMTLEHPGSMGLSFHIEPETPLIGILSVGQNRWMFHTKAITSAKHRSNTGPFKVLKVYMPEKVERCMRRNFDRTSTARVDLPSVNAWPLLNHASAGPIEIASRLMIDQLRDQGTITSASVDPQMLPEVGPKFEAKLANIGGGGVGLIVNKENRASLDSVHLFWLSVNLLPAVPAPLVMVARMAHTHIDSQQNTYAGLAFDFSQSTDHKHFVVSQIDRFIRQSQIQTHNKAA
ncbi:MAG: hypothetical protein JKY43_06940 [Phycisphaerales bacterium]|nr:hypothetical protein [Phycisphaerales bacterium]